MQQKLFFKVIELWFSTATKSTLLVVSTGNFYRNFIEVRNFLYKIDDDLCDFRNKIKFLSFLRKRCNVNPARGPYHHRAPRCIFRRCVRGIFAKHLLINSSLMVHFHHVIFFIADVLSDVSNRNIRISWFVCWLKTEQKVGIVTGLLKIQSSPPKLVDYSFFS